MKIALNWKWDLHNTRKIKVKSLFQGLAHFSFQMGLLFRYIDIRKDSSREKKKEKKNEIIENPFISWQHLVWFISKWIYFETFFNLMEIFHHFSIYYYSWGSGKKMPLIKIGFNFFFGSVFWEEGNIPWMRWMRKKKNFFFGEIRDPEIAVIFSFFS